MERSGIRGCGGYDSVLRCASYGLRSLVLWCLVRMERREIRECGSSGHIACITLRDVGTTLSQPTAGGDKLFNPLKREIMKSFALAIIVSAGLLLHSGASLAVDPSDVRQPITLTPQEYS